MMSATSPQPSVPSPAIRGFSGLGRARDLGIAGAIGALFGLYEYVEIVRTDNLILRDALAGALIGGFVGFMINAADAFREGAWWKLSRSASWGALAGAVGGAIGLIVGEIVLGGFQGGLVGRAVSWAILGLGIGVSQGLAYRSVARLRFGLIGGGAGGFLGGLLFETLRARWADRPDMSQGLGVAILGAGLGVCLALVERVLGRDWVQVLNGRQEGRTYLLTNRVSAVGLDERAEVGLFGDPSVARKHVQIERTAGGHLLVDLDNKGRTLVNGGPVQGSTTLKNGDRIDLGGTRLLFRDRASR